MSFAVRLSDHCFPYDDDNNDDDGDDDDDDDDDDGDNDDDDQATPRTSLLWIAFSDHY